ncbi:hypothetical protein IFM89_007193 [Coptis chinensis]|uniref:DUF4283 domain-containing protein n=1 Tax=Coptis chinensis TaxID=261450 RepID=A0A835LIK5_9MAGN|nr:hypothetical protein IFM89_007193 [Coptis chinensis]
MLDLAEALRGQASSSESSLFTWSSLFNNQNTTFVNENLEFLETIEEEDVTIVPNEVIEDGLELWRGYLVGFFVEKRMPFPMVKSTLDRAWKTKAAYEISTDRDLFYFKFMDYEDRQKVLDGGPIFIAGRIFIIRPWSEDLEYQREHLKSVPI